MAKFLRFVAVLVPALAAGADLHVVAGTLSLVLDEKSGRVTGVRSGAHDIPIQRGKALLQVRDVTGADVMTPVEGAVRRDGSGVAMEGDARGMGVRGSMRLRQE